MANPVDADAADTAVEFQQHKINWNATKKTDVITLTRSDCKDAHHLRVTMISVDQLFPHQKQSDEIGQVAENEKLCSTVRDFRNVKPAKTLEEFADRVNILDDLSIAFAFIFAKFTWRDDQYHYNSSSFDKLLRFRSNAKIDEKRGHFGRAALVKVDGKLYPLVLNGQYVLSGELFTIQKAGAYSTRLSHDSDIPFFSVLDVDIDPELIGDLKCFDEYFNLTKGQYSILFDQKQMFLKDPRVIPDSEREGSASDESLKGDKTMFHPSGRPQRCALKTTYNDRAIFRQIQADGRDTTTPKRKSRRMLKEVASGDNKEARSSITHRRGSRQVPEQDNSDEDKPLTCKRRTSSLLARKLVSDRIISKATVDAAILPFLEDTTSGTPTLNPYALSSTQSALLVLPWETSISHSEAAFGFATPINTESPALMSQPVFTPDTSASASTPTSSTRPSSAGTGTTSTPIPSAADLRALAGPFRKYLRPPTTLLAANANAEQCEAVKARYGGVEKMLEYMLEGVKREAWQPYENSLQDLERNVELRRLQEKMDDEAA